MKKILTTCLLLCLPVFAQAAGGDVPLEKADINLENKSSLRHGAKLFMNYCLSCHSAGYMRYNRMAKDLGLTDEQVENNMMFVASFEKEDAPAGEAKSIGSLMTIAMQPKEAKKYFGTTVPDLSVMVRSKNQLFAPSSGADWLYTYLTTFYIDESRPFGVNNEVSGNVAMPHVFWELEGLKKRVPIKREGGKETFKYEYVTEGKLSEVEYKRAVNDLVNFMVYMSEPIKVERQRTGIFVMFFLLIFFFFAYLLKKEFWKDVH
jgi:ubiquinol-cytochrome c reductase cytochrome c1 subunit